MKTRLCDRCGKSVRGGFYTREGTEVRHTVQWYHKVDYDLCRGCTGSFELFMRGGVVAPVQKEVLE